MLVKIAQDVGRLVGTTERKAGEWVRERQELVDRLTRMRDGAARLLAELESNGASAVSAIGDAIRRKRPPARKRRKNASRHKPIDAATRKERLASETRRSKQATHVKASGFVRDSPPSRQRKRPERKG
jgi:hypothetical protein